MPSFVAAGDDLDGDNGDGQDDTEVAFNDDIQGTVPQRLTDDPSSEHAFFIGTGAPGGAVTVEWEVTSVPVSGSADDLIVSIDGPDDVNRDNSAEGESTCDLTGAGPGEYTIVIRHSQQAAQAKDYTGTVTFVYWRLHPPPRRPAGSIEERLHFC